MADLTFLDAGTASVANGATTITFTGAGLGNGVGRGGDTFFAKLQPLVPEQRIASFAADGATAELAYPWPGTTMVDAGYEVRLQSDDSRATGMVRQYLALLGELANLGIQPKAFGVGADRDQYDGREKGFIFLDMGDPWTLYAKQSGDDADWGTGQTIEGAKGDQGDQGESGLIGVWREAWLTATDYELLDAVAQGGSSYICEDPHTSGVFATDLAAGKWRVVAARGDQGLSAYEVAVANGFVGDEAAWLASLQGSDGTMNSVVEGDGISVDSTDPANPVVSLHPNTQATIAGKATRGNALAYSMLF